MEEVGITNTGTVNKRPNPHNKWIPFEVLHGHDDAIHVVSWAPNMGSLSDSSRSYHLIATSSKDHEVGIFKLSNKPDGYSIENIAMLLDHGVEVWKVEWNITGTILSGDDGKVRLWKFSHHDEWKCMRVISYERQNDNMEM
ncbi:hypothetical protein C2G38_2257004 [Gigaspora rosea]|uniref:WD40-repeat-containing domain protein n=1 Tax=Gigaspora rosea TaxID=44941 RepID=A0A397TTY1_9GLOM|nr:hypothetical protein C2G38_2257004 [Gigaspora rosea]